MRSLLPALALTAACLAPHLARAQAQPTASYRRLTSANGWAPLVYDVEQRRVTAFRENMYRYPAPDRAETRNLAFDLYLGLRAGGQGGWLTDVRIEEAGYLPGTNLVRTVQRSEGLRVTSTYFAPYGLPARAFVVVAEVTAERDASAVSLYSLHNFHLGSGPGGTSGEQVAWDGRALVETGAGGPGALVILPLTAAAHRTATPANPYGLVQAGQPFADVIGSGTLEDAVSGLQFDLGDLRAGTTAQVAFAVGWAPSGDGAALVAQLAAWHAGRSPRAILDDAAAEWAAWIGAGVVPAAARGSDEEAIALQSLAILRMGQVTETGTPDGQLLASLPPGHWDIAWVRDAMWAVNALTETGHHAEAERALDFYTRGPFGAYRSYVGRDYGLSVCRYYGNGAEESDANDRGPNVELDGFGLYLEAAAAHVRAAPSGAAWLERSVDRISSGVADVLVDTADAETGLVMAESSIWESHWTGGGRQRWVFTSGTAVIGLRAWADVLAARDPGDPRAARYRARAAVIANGMRAHLIDRTSGALGASVEQLARPDRAFADAQAALVLGPHTITASSATGLATLELLRQRLFLGSTTARGYKRNDDGDLYDEREWVVVDLGIARALRDAGRGSEADRLVEWITRQAVLNYGIVPELLDQTTGTYAGETPMIGFGAGAYLRSLVHAHGTRAVDGPGPDGGLDAGGDGGGDAGTDAAVRDGEPAEDAGAVGRSDGDVRDDGGTAARVDAGARGAETARPAPSGCSTGPETAWSVPVLIWLGWARKIRRRSAMSERMRTAT